MTWSQKSHICQLCHILVFQADTKPHPISIRRGIGTLPSSWISDIVLQNRWDWKESCCHLGTKNSATCSWLVTGQTSEHRPEWLCTMPMTESQRLLKLRVQACFLGNKTQLLNVKPGLVSQQSQAESHSHGLWGLSTQNTGLQYDGECGRRALLYFKHDGGTWKPYQGNGMHIS